MRELKLTSTRTVTPGDPTTPTPVAAAQLYYYTVPLPWSPTFPGLSSRPLLSRPLLSRPSLPPSPPPRSTGVFFSSTQKGKVHRKFRTSLIRVKTGRLTGFNRNETGKKTATSTIDGRRHRRFTAKNRRFHHRLNVNQSRTKISNTGTNILGRMIGLSN